MSRIVEQQKEERFRGLTIVAGWMIIASLGYVAVSKGFAGIAMPGVNILQRIVTIVLCALAIAVVARLLLYVYRFFDEYNRANELEYLLWLISQGKEYYQVEEYLIGLEGLERRRREARAWVVDEGPERFHEERNGRRRQRQEQQKG